MHHQHLAVAAGTGPDADGGDGQLGRHALGQLGGNGLEHHGEGAGLFHCVGVFQKLAGRIGGLALHLEAAQSVDALRREADVGAHGNLAVDDGADAVGHLHAALQLHGIGAGLLHETPGVHHGIAHARLVGHEGHIHDDERVLRAARHRCTVVNHVLHSDRHGVAQAQHHVAERIADEDDHRDLLARLLHG